MGGMETSSRVRNGALAALGVVGLGAALLGSQFYAVYNDEVFWNIGANSHVWWYVHPVLYGATALLGIAATIAGARGVMAPVRPPWRLLPWVLALLILLTLWASASSAMARVYLV